MIMSLLSKNGLTKALTRMTSKKHKQSKPFGKMTLPYSEPPCVPALVDELPEMLGASQGLVLAERHFRAEQEI